MPAEVDPFEQAQLYAGNIGADYFMCGICQLELLKRTGLKQYHHVLEMRSTSAVQR